MESREYKMLESLNTAHEVGRQRCFEPGNPFYFKDAADSREPANEMVFIWSGWESASRGRPKLP
jgi:hypothetical protein